MQVYKLIPDPPTQPTSERKSPGDIGLELSAHVLRLPILPAARLVLAEIISLHFSNKAKGGVCDASDGHFHKRLSISKGTVSNCVTLLYDAKLIDKTVDKERGFYRVLSPRMKAIEAASQLNPYPNYCDSPPTPKIGVAYPNSEGSPTTRIGVALPQELVTNLFINSSVKSSEELQSLSAADAARRAVAAFDKAKEKAADAESVSSAESAAIASARENLADAERVTKKVVLAPKVAPAAKKRTARESKQAALLTTPQFLAELLNPGGDAARVQELDIPLTDKQATALSAEFGEAQLIEIFCAMANYKPLLKTSTNANLTARKWLARRADDKKKESDERFSTNTANNYGAGRYQPRHQNGAKPDADAGQFARALAYDE